MVLLMLGLISFDSPGNNHVVALNELVVFPHLSMAVNFDCAFFNTTPANIQYLFFFFWPVPGGRQHRQARQPCRTIK